MLISAANTDRILRSIAQGANVRFGADDFVTTPNLHNLVSAGFDKLCSRSRHTFDPLWKRVQIMSDAYLMWRPRTIGLRHFPRRAAAEQKAQQLFVRDVAELALDEVQLLMILVLGLEVERFQ